MGHYAQLIQEQRYRIERGIAAGWSNKDIAEFVGVHPSTISRELKRNAAHGSLWGYCAEQAGESAERRRRRPETRTAPELIEESKRLASLGWSPEQVAGRMRQERGLTFSASACRERARSDSDQAHLRHGKSY